jgi:hypothetical protein
VVGGPWSSKGLIFLMKMMRNEELEVFVEYMEEDMFPLHRHSDGAERGMELVEAVRGYLNSFDFCAGRRRWGYDGVRARHRWRR